ncbi:YcxB family protein [Novosphingobium sp.]|uniref:YcxB family protein n=1 Tax=Novosphingobium sp. TaxID=1874826 RepID=UPI00333E8C02
MRTMQTVSYQPIAADLIEANRLYYVSSMRSQGAIKIFTLSVLVFSGIAISEVWNEGIYSIVTAFFVGLLLGTVFVIGALSVQYFLIPRLARKNFDQQKTLQDHVELVWTDVEIIRKTARSQSTLSWSDFRKMYRSKQVVVLMQSDRAFNHIPLRALTPEQTASIEEYFARAHLG